ncbi:hypothetical protein ACOSP7_006986 [Xanthoceras sorbifolium]
MLNQDVGKLALCSNFVLIVWRWLQFADAAAINHVPHLDTWEVSEQIRNGIVLPWKHKKLSSTGEKKYINCGKRGHNRTCCENQAAASSSGKAKQSRLSQTRT